MKRKTKIMALTLVFFYIIGVAVLGFSSPPSYSLDEDDVLFIMDQGIYEKIEKLKEELVLIERAIDQYNERLMMEKSIIDFIEATNPQVSNHDKALIAKISYREARKYNLDPLIIIAIIYQESRFKKEAIGGVGEIGLMQVMPSTAEKMALQMHWNDYNLYYIEDNIQIGTRYLIYCLNRTTEYTQNSLHNLEYGLSAYNRGLGAVLRDLEAGRDPKNRYQEEVLMVHTRILEEYF